MNKSCKQRFDAVGARAARVLRATATAALLLGLVGGGGGVAMAETTRFYELEGFGHFLDGNPESTAVTDDGAVALPPTMREWYADAAVSFSAVAAAGGEAERLFAARADDAQVVSITPDGAVKSFYQAAEPLVTALLWVGDALWVAAGPPARLYRVTAAGKAEKLFSGDASYIWALAAGADGAVYAVTGEPGQVLKFDRQGKSRTLFASDQRHLRSVAFDAELGLLVGGGERGIVYHSKNERDFRALADTGATEVTAMAVHAGSIYVAGVSGAAELVAGEGATAPVLPPARAEVPGNDIGGGLGEDAAGPTGEGGDNGAAPTKAVTAASHAAGGGGGSRLDVRSQLFRVQSDGAVESLAGSGDEAIFALGVDRAGRVLVATGAAGREEPHGRLYTVDPERHRIAMVFQSPSKRITHLVPTKKGAWLAVAAAGGRISEMGESLASVGEFFTPPFDTGITASFGLLQLFGDIPDGTQVAAQVRSGQTATPDQSWSAWSGEIRAPSGTAAAVAHGRFVQLRLKLKSERVAQKISPQLYRVRLAYLRQNLAPVVREVVALRKGLALVAVPQEEPKSKMVSLLDKLADEMRSDKTVPRPADAGALRARQVNQPGALTLKWSAEDPNDDELRYDLWVRPAAGGAPWRLIKANLSEPFYTLQSFQLPDGYYQFRVVAVDAPANPEPMEKSSTQESRAVLVDNTAPQVTLLQVKSAGRDITVSVEAMDGVGPLMEAVYALDGAPPRPLATDDGVLDGPRESFQIKFKALPPGKHTLTVRVSDEAGNEGHGQAEFVVH